VQGTGFSIHVNEMEGNMKRCKVCGQNLPLDMYQSASKGKKRGTCKPCFKVKFQDRLRMQARRNKKKPSRMKGHARREAARMERIKTGNPEKFSRIRSKCHESRMENLPDSYVRQLLKASPSQEIPQELMDAKRLQVKISRILR
jgi:hypothetical protein